MWVVIMGVLILLSRYTGAGDVELSAAGVAVVAWLLDFVGFIASRHHLSCDDCLDYNMTGKIIRTVQCCTVHHSCTQL